MKINEIKLKIINIYGPNKDDPNFYRVVAEKIQVSDHDYLIWCGDFNMTLLNFVSINNPKARGVVNSLIEETNRVDLFRFCHPDTKRYTWRKKNPLKQARLDYILVSTCFTDMIDSVNIKPGYRSDHSMVEFTFLISNFERGRGTWKFNNSLLKDQKYLTLINNCIREEYKRYAIPLYQHEFLEKGSYQDIQLTIPQDLFLETILLRIRGESIKYGAFKKRSNSNFEKLLLSEIEKLESGNNTTDIEMLELKRQELVEYRQQEMKGHMIRSRTQWVTEGEKPSQYFCALEHGNYLDKTIKHLQKQDKTFTRDQKEILNEVKDFYAKLFGESEKTSNVDLHNLLRKYNVKKLSKCQATTMEGYLSSEELGIALKSTKNNKSPGLDGFSFEFFKIF